MLFVRLLPVGRGCLCSPEQPKKQTSAREAQNEESKTVSSNGDFPIGMVYNREPEVKRHTSFTPLIGLVTYGIVKKICQVLLQIKV